MSKPNIIIGNKPPLEALTKELKARVETLEKVSLHLIDDVKPKNINQKNMNSEIKSQPLPFWKRAFFDTFREGTFAIAGVLLASGAWDLVVEFLNTGDFSINSLYKFLLSIIAVLAGYLQALAKAERKEAEKQNNI